MPAPAEVKKESKETKRLKQRIARMEQEQARELLRSRLQLELARHIGRSNAIGMGELFEAVFGQDWQHRINDTRPLRKLIHDLRNGATPLAVCSVCCSWQPGYYLAAAGSELEKYVDRLKKRALKILAQAAGLEKRTLPEMLGQLALAEKTGDRGRETGA